MGILLETYVLIGFSIGLVSFVLFFFFACLKLFKFLQDELMVMWF